MIRFLSLRGASATKQSNWIAAARFAHLAVTTMLFIALGAPARAHDPYEAFTAIVVRADRMELTLTMAQSTALKLIDPAARIAGLTPENIATHRPQLVREGAALFIVTSLRAPLAARKVEVELTEENDVVFTVTYPRPAPGRLLLSAAYLKRLGEGYGGIATVDDESNRNLGWEQLLWERPNFEATIPSAAPPQKK